MNQTIQFSDDQITLLNQLEKLFEYASPESISKSLHEVFFSYLQNNNDVFPDDFATTAGDFQFLIRFMRGAEKLTDVKKL